MRPKEPGFTLIEILAVLTMALMLPTGAGASGTTKILYSFKDKPDGAAPVAGLIFDTAGNLYGTTSKGGSAGMGAIFKLTRNSDGSWSESVLYSFAGGSDGATPDAEVVFDGSGNLYGTTAGGGDIACGCGTVFELTPNSDGTWKESVLHRFTGADGYVPFSRLIFDTTGNLYGTTWLGGDLSCDQVNKHGCGTVFKMTPDGHGGWTESVIHKFENSDGYGVLAPVVFDGSGNLYGTAVQGGAKNQGTIFKLTPQSSGPWTLSVLHSFTEHPDGALPSAGLIFDGANLYGTTVSGGNNDGTGTVFKVDTKGHLKVFPNHPGNGLRAGLVAGPAHTLYGNAVDTGPLGGGGGTIFKLTVQPGGVGTFTELHRFHGKPAMHPWGTLVRAKGGHLYGTSKDCGKGEGCAGTVFEIRP